MKKHDDFWITPQNPPNLKKNTWLLGLFFFFSGLNCILGAILDSSKEDSGYLILMGLCLLIVLPIIVTDERMANRGKLAVIGSSAMFMFVSLLVAFVLSSCIILFVFLLESFSVISYFLLKKCLHKNSKM